MPYIVHPCRVALMMMQKCAPDYVVAAAFLHDVYEDCHGYDLSDFPEKVLSIVRDLTEKDELTKVENFERLRGLKDALWIKLADRIDNLMEASPYTRRYRANQLTHKTTSMILGMAREVGLSDYQIYGSLHLELTMLLRL